MEKLQLKIPVILPQVPNEKDSCVERLIQKLQAKEGIEKVHIADENGDDVPQLCFHYDPDIISIDRTYKASSFLREKPFGNQWSLGSFRFRLWNDTT